MPAPPVKADRGAASAAGWRAGDGGKPPTSSAEPSWWRGATLLRCRPRGGRDPGPGAACHSGASRR